jgi:hypothetical protein
MSVPPDQMQGIDSVNPPPGAATPTASVTGTPIDTPAIGESNVVRGDPDSPLLSDLYQDAPPIEAAVPAPAVDATMAGVQDATAATAVATGGAAEEAVAAQVAGGPTEMSAAEQLNKITSQDSPNMVRARNQGMLSAAKRGLGESTIAGQASQGAMVDRALPLAQQDAATALSIAQENANRNQQVSLLNAQLGTDVSKFNAAQLNEAENLNAQMQTAVNQGNADAYNKAQQQFADLQTRADLTNADQQFKSSQQYAQERNAMTSQLQTQISELNKQYLAGSQAIDLAQIQGQYQNLIAQNESAARIFDSYLSGMASIMSNKDISPSRVAQYVQGQLTQVEGALQFMQDLNNLDLDEFTLGPQGYNYEPPVLGDPDYTLVAGDPGYVAPPPPPAPPPVRPPRTQPDRSCFTGDTLVTMFDGTDKLISDVEVGEELLGRDGYNNTVIEFDHPLLGNRELYSFNDGEPFVTAEHPFMTSTGWKSISPVATAKENPDLEVGDLLIGDYIEQIGEPLLKITALAVVHADPETQLYNFKLSGNKTYYANGYLVHNKGDDGAGGGPSGGDGGGGGGGGDGSGCFAKGTLFCMADGTFKPVEDIDIGDETKGGYVTTVKRGKSFNKWYSYRGTHVTDEHFVLEDGEWKYVMDSDEAKQIDSHDIFYTLDTTKHRLYGINEAVFSDDAVFDIDYKEDWDQWLEILNDKLQGDSAA